MIMPLKVLARRDVHVEPPSRACSAARKRSRPFASNCVDAAVRCGPRCVAPHLHNDSNTETAESTDALTAISPQSQA